MKKKILLIGGAGYIGTVVTRYYLKKKYRVICLDNFLYKNTSSIDEFKNDKKFEFVFGDLRDEKLINDLLDKCDVSIILGGLVGDPITKKYPELSEKINFFGIKKIIDLSKKKKISNTIFVSTCSNYGLSQTDDLLTEESPLNPLSLYAKQKVGIEKYILSLRDEKFFNPTILRFSTAFGLSPRMRFDLTINQFTRSIFYKEKLEVFDSNTWRPYCHVNDFALAIDKVIETNKKYVNFEVFNVGSEHNNFTKKQITEQILNIIPNNNKEVSFTNKKFDPRNYKVDFSKIKNKLDFKVKYTIREGIEEIIEFLKKNKINNNKEIIDSFNFGNYQINL